MSGRGVRLVFLGWLFVVWVGWLAWQTRHAHSVVVSRSQLAVTSRAVVAEVEAGADGKPLPLVKNVSPRRPEDGEKRESLEIANLPTSRGFRAPGQYLLLLSGPEPMPRITLPPRSPGADAEMTPLIYPWDDDVRVQFEQLTAK